jgi:hypothetical protein
MMDRDRALREEVALANRIVERFGLSNAFGPCQRAGGRHGHVPAADAALSGLRRCGRPATIDFDGKVVDGDGEPNSEHWIHGRLYAARADVMSVVHAHPPACVCLTQIGQPHRVVHNQGGTVRGRHPEYDRVG